MDVRRRREARERVGAVRGDREARQELAVDAAGQRRALARAVPDPRQPVDPLLREGGAGRCGVDGTLPWAAANPMASGVNDVLWAADKKVSLQLRFTAESGSWQIDDLFVDPQKRG
jgi:hypothetical protein